MSFLDNLKDKFKKRDDQAIYLSGFKKTKDSMGQKLNEISYKYKGINDDKKAKKKNEKCVNSYFRLCV